MSASESLTASDESGSASTTVLSGLEVTGGDDLARAAWRLAIDGGVILLYFSILWLTKQGGRVSPFLEVKWISRSGVLGDGSTHLGGSVEA
jgi:hypothetical protein